MDKLVNIFKIFSDETRLRIIVLLAQQELCVCELSGILDVSQPKVSKGLSKLRDMSLVIDKRKDKYVFYKLKPDNVILTDTVKNIINNINNYPQLMIDKSKLADKEKCLNQCSININ